jgi:cytochrome c biogenesis protein CcdA/thiol-disulfide isomerase/thioredoxin
MTLVLITYIAGVLTILSPCILPMLPFVFSKSEQSFMRGHLPLLFGMAVTFSILSALTIVGGSWIGQVSGLGRWLALIFLGLFGLSLALPQLSDKILAPLTALGAKLNPHGKKESIGGSVLIGISTGLLWAPCAGPILGLVLTGAASQNNLATSVGLLLSYSAGAATSLALALLGGKKLFAVFKGFLGFEHSFKRVLGVVVLLGVVAVAFNVDRTVLTRLSKIETTSLETKLLSIVNPTADSSDNDDDELASEGDMPELTGAVSWLNSAPLTKADLKGKVVVIDFWTYSCINCLRTLPYVKAWAEKYKDNGLVVIGVHTPEFGFEKELKNVQNAVKDLGITYPVAIDSAYAIWKAFHNQFWPAHYFVDREGHVRYHHFGEGEYAKSEDVIRTLLTENGEKILGETKTDVQASGVEAASKVAEVKSPETYIGYDRAENFAATEDITPDREATYKAKENLRQNDWSLEGRWFVEQESAILTKPHGKIIYRFHARDLHLVLGGDKTVHFKVTLDGHAPGANHGVDINSDGVGTVTSHRLYQLIRQPTDAVIEDHTFEIEFLDPSVEAFAFTFG